MSKSSLANIVLGDGAPANDNTSITTGRDAMPTTENPTEKASPHVYCIAHTATDNNGNGSALPIKTILGAPDEIPDPFDPRHLRLSQNFGTTLDLKKTLITVPVRKPSKEVFVQVHPGQDYQLQTCVIELKDDREVYLIDRLLWPAMSEEATFGARALFTSITRQGVVFLWPIRLPGPDGKLDPWNESALEAARQAQGTWIRVTANMNLGAYDVVKAPGSFSPPTWPEVSFQDLLRTAFKGKFIDSLDHLVLRKLRGEV